MRAAHSSVIAALVLLLAAAPSAYAAPPAKVRAVEGITEYSLDNGLRVLLFPDASKATVTVNITYLVGSRHEGYGETGMAHLLEHMLFKGTPTHPNPWKSLQDHGAQFNGTTWWDRTNYYEEMPASSENLDFALRLEADRMVNSKIAQEDLGKEFSVVRNEFEMGESNPAGVLEEKMLAAAYQWHNYGKSTIGSRSDIERVPIENLRGFYKKHYQPDNAILILAGKFDDQQALTLVDKYFAGLPRPARKLAPTWTEEPVQDGERVVVLRRTGDVAIVSLLYHGVAGPDPDWVAQDAIADILTHKPAGRLYKALVEKGLASEVYGTVYPTAEPGVVLLGAKVRAGGSPEKVREVMIRTVEALARDPIRPEEVERWRARSIKEFELALTETATVGVALSDWAALGDWRLFFLTRDRVKTATVDDVARFAKKYLKESNRTVGMFVPTKTPERAPLPPRPEVVTMMKDYRGSAAVSHGEVFVASPDSVEARTRRVTVAGLKLALMPRKTKGGAVRLSMTVRFGSEKDLQGRTTVATMLPQMLMRGTKKRSFQQIKDELDRLRAEVSFGGGGRLGVPNPGVAQVSIKTVRDSLPAVLGLVIEMLREPAFPAKELETLRKELLAQLEEQLADPMRNAMRTLSGKMFPWPKDDVRHIPSLKETIERVKKVQAADLVRMHKGLWGASAAQVAIVGDFDEEAVKTIVDKTLASWKSPRPYLRVARPYRNNVVGEETINTPDKEMAFVGVGHPLAMRDDDPAYPALVMLDHLVGGSASSRLLERLRQKEGLSYGAFSSVNALPQDQNGLFFAGAITAPQNAHKAMGLIVEELKKVLEQGIGDKELAEGKISYARSFETLIAEDAFVSGELAEGLYLDRTFAYWKALNGSIAKLTAAEVNAAARKYIKLDKLTQVTAGDLSKMKS